MKGSIPYKLDPYGIACKRRRPRTSVSIGYAHMDDALTSAGTNGLDRRVVKTFRAIILRVVRLLQRNDNLRISREVTRTIA